MPIVSAVGFRQWPPCGRSCCIHVVSRVLPPAATPHFCITASFGASVVVTDATAAGEEALAGGGPGLGPQVKSEGAMGAAEVTPRACKGVHREQASLRVQQEASSHLARRGRGKWRCTGGGPITQPKLWQQITGLGVGDWGWRPTLTLAYLELARLLAVRKASHAGYGVHDAAPKWGLHSGLSVSASLPVVANASRASHS